MCKLCGDADKTLNHISFECKAMQECRQPFVAAIESACGDLGIYTLSVGLNKLVIDCSPQTLSHSGEIGLFNVESP